MTRRRKIAGLTMAKRMYDQADNIRWDINTREVKRGEKRTAATRKLQPRLFGLISARSHRLHDLTRKLTLQYKRAPPFPPQYLKRYIFALDGSPALAPCCPW
jgi:hypothetical protein